MRLFWYFAKFYAGIVALMQAGLVIVVVGASFVEKAGYLAKSDHGAREALFIAGLAAIQFGHLVFPVACFLATLVAGTLLARSGEMLAVQAAGIPTRRIGLAFTSVVAVAAALGVLMGDLVVPSAKARIDQAQRGDQTPAGQTLGRFFDRHTQWFRQGDLLLYLPSYDAETGAFGQPVVYRLSTGLVTSVIDAERLVFEDGGWWLVSAREHEVDTATIVSHPRLSLPLTIGARDLVDVTGEPSVMGWRDLSEVASRRERAGFDSALFRVELYNRLAFPLSALCMFLLALPWALDPGRRRSLAVNLGSGVVGVFVLLSLWYIFRLLALSHKLSPGAGSWALDVLAVGLAPASWALYQRHRTRGSIF
jgi:LPS export ABC transporter permease LptG